MGHLQAPSTASSGARASKTTAIWWLRRVLARWGLDPWVVAAFIGLVDGRRVAWRVRGELGPCRALARSIGMGGAANHVVPCLRPYRLGSVHRARCCGPHLSSTIWPPWSWVLHTRCASNASFSRRGTLPAS